MSTDQHFVCTPGTYSLHLTYKISDILLIVENDYDILINYNSYN